MPTKDRPSQAMNITYARIWLPYAIFRWCKKIWTATGIPLPAWLRHIRHSILGAWWPAHAEITSAEESEEKTFARGTGLNILVIDDFVPQPDKDSGSLRRSRMMEIMKKDGADVTFLPSNLWRTAKYSKLLEEKGIRVIGLPRIRFIQQHLFEEGRMYDIVLIGRVQNMTAFAKAVRHFAPHAALIFDTVDLHFLRMERWAALDGKRTLQRAAARCKKQELNAVRNADCTIVVSDEEKKLLLSHVPGAMVEVISNIHDVKPAQKPFAERHDIVFIGAYGHEPNADAAQYLAKEIWPLVREKIPDATLKLVGEDPDKELNGLDGNGVTVTGYVPDLDSVLEYARVSVAPLRFGAGVKGKINMSMSRGVPVVSTSIGAEGMDLRHEHNALIADNADDFAAMIVRAYGDERLWKKLSDAGPALIHEKFSDDHARVVWEEIAQRFVPPSVLAIIPTAYKDPAMLGQCVDSLISASNGVKLRIIIVLCPATNQAESALRSRLNNRAECIAMDGPFSFARSNNAGLAALKDETHVLLLNDDCFFRRQDDVRMLIDALREKKLAAIGPWLEHRNYKNELPREKKTRGLHASPFPLVGACMIWDRTWLDAIGPFDESFSGYGMEEADLLLRVLEKGGRWMRNDRVTVDHIHHATFGKSIKDEEPHHRNLARWHAKYPNTDSWGRSSEWERNTNHA